MTKEILAEILTVSIGIIGLLLAGSDAVPNVWPYNVLAGVVLLAAAGLLALSRPAPRR